MKLRNLAFFGVMASILSVASAQAAEGDNYIASKGYVDNKVSTVSTNLGENYYNKTQVDAAIHDAADAAQAAAEETAAADATSKANAAQAVAEEAAAAAEQNAKDYADGKFATTTSMNTALANKADTSYVNTELAKKQNTLTFDDTPTENSTNPVTSGGVQAAIAALPQADNTYTKGEVDTALAAKANSADVYTQTAADAKFADKAETTAALNTKANSADLATVATSGNYADLTNTPALGALAAKNTVAKTDLATAVQTSLDAADAAAPQATTYTKTEVDGLLDAKQATVGNGTVNATTNEVVTGVTTTAGVVTAVSSALIADANVSGTANIAPAKLNLSQSTCPSGKTCLLTYDASGNYAATPIQE